MGVYPLLPNETCWFLAIDLDGASWSEDVLAFAQTCAAAAVPAVVERSRSGDGAHVWFFFAEPIPAVLARQMGCALITATMARRHEMGMASYDRLFPNQDTMPRGGFGSLIALPLQHGPRQEGHSVFLNLEDASLAPYGDHEQWTYLASVRRLDRVDVEKIVHDANQSGAVLGVRLPDVGEESDTAPWMRPPSRVTRPVRTTEPVPSHVNAVLAQRLFVEKAGLPPAFLNQIKRLAAFQNPEFYKKQSLRLSTALTPRIIMCAEDLSQHIALPRGCRFDLEDLLREYASTLDVDDQRISGAPLDTRFQGTLTPIQARAVEAILAHDIGVFVASPGAGKTVVGTYLVAARACSTLILVHRQPLLDQWRAQLAIFLGVNQKAIGQVGGGKRISTGRIDIAMIQSLVRKDRVDDIVASYGQVIVDECHHTPAVSFERVLNQVKGRYVVGLTATPHRRDGHHPIADMQLGPVRFAVDHRNQQSLCPFDRRLIVRNTAFKVVNDRAAPTIQQLYAALAGDDRRNRIILDDVMQALEEKRSPILLTERRDHLEFFAAKLGSFARHLVVLRGGMGVKERRRVQEQLAAIPPHEERLLLATGRYIGEGFDDARLDALFLTLPVSWRGTLVQYTGRLHRLHPGKTDVRIYDYVDRDVPMLLRMFQRRLRGYRAIGYVRNERPVSDTAISHELLVEYEAEIKDRTDFG
ncbi:MAG: DEAD/DEAH box helicase family protein [Acidobacteria bacterium]|nr:DEAD/DEAH box helicase family protein [Acidobacteriota bacterium]